jgi:CRP-like cAMP-binding protein
MFASICEVKEYKLGEIIMAQGMKPNACYLVAYGRLQSVYQYVEK